MELPGPWPLLHRARAFTVDVTRPDGDRIVSHAGAGQIQVETRDETGGAVIVWREHGRWTAGPLAGIPFRNATAWRLTTGTQRLELSHLRRGDLEPTFLVALVPSARGSWESERPHRCGQDTYQARLQVAGEQLELWWDVQSPTDPYQLRLVAHTRA